jgi:general secretion pathway protein K
MARVQPSPPAAARRGDSGFALIIVLWTLVLVAFIATQLVANGRVEIRIAGNLAANAVAEAAADGAVYRAVFNLLDPDPRRRWALDGAPHEFAIGDCRATVQLSDEAARINPSQASAALLAALLRTTGTDDDRATQLAAAIGDWVGAAGEGRPQEAMLTEYRAAGRDYAPPGEPLESLDELERVPGITRDIYAAIRPHLSLYAGATPDLSHADPVVRAAVALLAPASARPPPPDPPSGILTARVAVTVQGPGRASVSRTAIVRATPLTQNHVILSWDAGD